MPQNVAIAIIAPIQPEDFYDQVWEGVWEATFDLASFGVRVENLTTEHRNLAQQREILQGLLGERMTAIAIAPSHTSALNDLIDQHELAGTPVITFQSDAPASKRSACVGADPRRSGALAAEVLAKLMGGRGRVLSLPGDREEFQFAGRYAGFQAELARHAGRIQESALTFSLDALKTAEGIYVGDDDLAKVASAMERTGIRVPCVGFGNTAQAREFLERGFLSAVVDESRHQQGYFAVQKAYQATLKREGLESLSVPSTVAFSVNAAQLEESLNDAFELLVRQRTEVLCSYKTRLEHTNADLINLSVTDPLTGLANRRQFETSLDQEVARARRYGAMSLLIIDVDQFKAVNDTYGHQVGDEVLKMVAGVLKSSCRGSDICARLGGDEFGIILPHSDGQIAAKVRERIARQIGALRHTVPVSVSAGIATLPGNAETIGELIAAADADMYRMKQASRAPHVVL